MEKELAKIILKSGKDQSLKRFHPWVFSGAIKKIKGAVQEGGLAEVYSNKDEFLGIGHYQEGSIAVRILSFTPTAIDDTFWQEKIQRAYNYRKQLGLIDDPTTNCFRLIFGEGDGLPGLIIDMYNGTAVVQCHSYGMYLLRDKIAENLKTVFGDQLTAIYDKSAETLPKAFEVNNDYLYGSSEGNVEASEYGHLFNVNWVSGQKTGFFLDQRENRKLLAQYSKDKTVLNTFCYTGGFSVYAGKAGAKEVHSVDSSKKAMELTDKNMELNNIQNHQSFAVDTFDFFKDNKTGYDIIILDPPAFAKHRNVKHNAVQGYKRLNAEAIRHIKPGGLLFTFSCSQVVDKNLFNNTITAAAIQAGRNIKVMHHLSQPPDHPVNIFHPEGEYLKGLVLRIDE